MNFIVVVISESRFGIALALLSDVGELEMEVLGAGGGGNDDRIGEETIWTEWSALWWRLFFRADVAVKGDHAAEKALGEDDDVVAERLEEKEIRWVISRLVSLFLILLLLLLVDICNRCSNNRRARPSGTAAGAITLVILE